MQVVRRSKVRIRRATVHHARPIPEPVEQPIRVAQDTAQPATAAPETSATQVEPEPIKWLERDYHWQETPRTGAQTRSTAASALSLWARQIQMQYQAPRFGLFGHEIQGIQQNLLVEFEEMLQTLPVELFDCYALSPKNLRQFLRKARCARVVKSLKTNSASLGQLSLENFLASLVSIDGLAAPNAFLQSWWQQDLVDGWQATDNLEAAVTAMSPNEWLLLTNATESWHSLTIVQKLGDDRWQCWDRHNGVVAMDLHALLERLADPAQTQYWQTVDKPELFYLNQDIQSHAKKLSFAWRQNLQMPFLNFIS